MTWAFVSGGLLVAWILHRSTRRRSIETPLSAAWIRAHRANTEGDQL